jgi:hypothetical protein
MYTSTPLNATIDQDGPQYKSDFSDSVHVDLRRDLRVRVPKKMNQTDQRPLFEKYQFLTPGLSFLPLLPFQLAETHANKILI